MKIFLVGATGFVGSYLTPALLAQGHQVSLLLRNQAKRGPVPPGVQTVVGNPMLPGEWQRAVAKAELIINLAGANVFTRWTDKSKESIMESRLLSTRHLVEAMGRGAPKTLINASAAGYYGYLSTEPRTEESPPGDDFLARVCVAWEDEAKKGERSGHRVVLARLAVVLGAGGGALGKMLTPFRLGLGGRIGDGRQPFPWIHIADLLSIFSFLIDNPEVRGAVNCVAPQQINNMEFTRAMGRALHRPTLLPLPGSILRLAMGEVSSAMLSGARVVPARLEQQGFKFRYPTIEAALSNLLGGKE